MSAVQGHWKDLWEDRRSDYAKVRKRIPNITAAACIPIQGAILSYALRSSLAGQINSRRALSGPARRRRESEIFRIDCKNLKTVL
jgi:hypothetical protein